MNCRENNLSTKSVSDLPKLESTFIRLLRVSFNNHRDIYKSKYCVKNSKQDSENQRQIHSSFFSKLRSHNKRVLLQRLAQQKREQKLIKPKVKKKKKKKNREEKNRHPEKREREDCHCSRMRGFDDSGDLGLSLVR